MGKLLPPELGLVWLGVGQRRGVLGLSLRGRHQEQRRCRKKRPGTKWEAQEKSTNWNQTREPCHLSLFQQVPYPSSPQGSHSGGGGGVRPGWQNGAPIFLGQFPGCQFWCQFGSGFRASRLTAMQHTHYRNPCLCWVLRDAAFWCNPPRTHYECGALPIELGWPVYQPVTLYCNRNTRFQNILLDARRFCNLPGKPPVLVPGGSGGRRGCYFPGEITT